MFLKYLYNHDHFNVHTGIFKLTFCGKDHVVFEGIHHERFLKCDLVYIKLEKGSFVKAVVMVDNPIEDIERVIESEEEFKEWFDNLENKNR